MITFKFPLPPSINHYYGQIRNRKFISKAGKKFRAQVQEIVTLAGVWLDDEQIDDLHLTRQGVLKGVFRMALFAVCFLFLN